MALATTGKPMAWASAMERPKGSGSEDPGSEQDGRQSQGDEQVDQMSKEQAERLLDSLADQEQENLRNQALQRKPGPARKAEKDW